MYCGERCSSERRAIPFPAPCRAVAGALALWLRPHRAGRPQCGPRRSGPGLGDGRLGTWQPGGSASRSHSARVQRVRSTASQPDCPGAGQPAGPQGTAPRANSAGGHQRRHGSNQRRRAHSRGPWPDRRAPVFTRSRLRCRAVAALELQPSRRGAPAARPHDRILVQPLQRVCRQRVGQALCRTLCGPCHSAPCAGPF